MALRFLLFCLLHFTSPTVLSQFFLYTKHWYAFRLSKCCSALKKATKPERPKHLHQRAIVCHDALATTQKRVRECKSRKVDERPGIRKGEECMVIVWASVRHTDSLAADWEEKPRSYLLCMRVPVCVTLCCPVNKAAAAAPWH